MCEREYVVFCVDQRAFVVGFFVKIDGTLDGWSIVPPVTDSNVEKLSRRADRYQAGWNTWLQTKRETTGFL